MRKIFLDCGAHKATSVKNFKERWPGAEEYEIFSFEANKGFKKFFEKYSDVKLKIALVWNKDGTRKFYNSNDESSSIYKTKASKRSKKQTIETIDLGHWIKENFNEDDYVVLKLDIEGAEYDVLEHMIEDGSIKYVNKLLIEWHCAKIKDITPSRHLDLLEKLTRLQIVPYVWSYTRTSFNSIATSMRNIVRGHDNKKIFKKKYEDRYNVVCKKLKELHNKNV